MKTLSLTAKSEDQVLTEALHVLHDGGVIIYPTETTYGIGVDATNPHAVAKILTYRENQEGKPISIAVANKSIADEYAKINEVADNVYKSFLPGPITVVSEGKHALPHGIESDIGTIGIRIPDYPFTLTLLERFAKPVTTTAPTAYYQKRAYSITDILDNISQRQKDLIDLIIDAGELPHNEPSTVVDTRLNAISILRQGNVTLSHAEERTSSSVEQTKDIAKEILQRYEQSINHRPVVFALQGDMGAGKTHFTKGIGEYLGISRVISSPTYVLEKDYPFTYEGQENELIHIDTWRIFASEELEELDIWKRMKKNNVIVVEWAEKAVDLISKLKGSANVIWIKFCINDDDSRTIIFSDSFIQ